MSDEYTPPSVVYGVVYGGGAHDPDYDYGQKSGAGPVEDSGPGPGRGTKTWVARGIVRDDTLAVDRCAPVDEWFDTVETPVETPTLTTFLADLPSTAAAGLDFPFGLPETLVVEESWTAFLQGFPAWCASPDDLRRQCERRLRLVEGSSDARHRATDEPLSAMSPFADSIVASTFYGIRDVLRPLVLSDTVRVPPMTPPHPDHPFVLEVYPTGTLVDLDLFVPGYEAPDDDGRTLRAETLDGLAEAGDLHMDVAADVRKAAVDDLTRLESIVAAYTVYRNTRTASALTVSDSRRLVEGQVFV